jgi:hypothetical protein
LANAPRAWQLERQTHHAQIEAKFRSRFAFHPRWNSLLVDPSGTVPTPRGVSTENPSLFPADSRHRHSACGLEETFAKLSLPRVELSDSFAKRMERLPSDRSRSSSLCNAQQPVQKPLRAETSSTTAHHNTRPNSNHLFSHLLTRL